MNQLKGFDVSNNNGAVNWPDVDHAGYPWGYTKATEGATFHDPTFVANYDGMKAAGILRGAYHFARFATSSPRQEAIAYVDIVEANGGFELPPMLDLEVSGGRSATQLQSDACEWWSVVKNHWTGDGKPFLYSYTSFISEYGLLSLSDIFDLWIADYSVSAPPTGAKIWQYTDSGSIHGINGHVDIDIFLGTFEELKALCQKH